MKRPVACCGAFH